MMTGCRDYGLFFLSTVIADLHKFSVLFASGCCCLSILPCMSRCFQDRCSADPMFLTGVFYITVFFTGVIFPICFHIIVSMLQLRNCLLCDHLSTPLAFLDPLSLFCFGCLAYCLPVTCFMIQQLTFFCVTLTTLFTGISVISCLCTS